MQHQQYSEDDFAYGVVTEVLQATNSPKLFVVWPHATEVQLGPRVGHSLYTKHRELLKHVDYMCGNPVAARARQETVKHNLPMENRYTKGGTDLNRSYKPTGTPKTYEEQRAQEILSQIRAGRYDYILDLHTSTTGNDRYFLVSKKYFDSAVIKTIIASSPIERVVVLPDYIAEVSLIGVVANAISAEYSRDLATKTGVEDTLKTIEGLIAGKSLIEPFEREVFYVSGVIPKENDPGPEARNFFKCKQGYYPVLLGEYSYRNDPSKNYLGFAADRKETIIL